MLPWSLKTTDEVTLAAFTDAMDSLSSTIEKLIVEAEAQHENLEVLEEDLSVIREVISREDSSISLTKSELLSELWTKLGGTCSIRHHIDGTND
jgi:predicted RNA-binding protein (virulence factor B family)